MPELNLELAPLILQACAAGADEAAGALQRALGAEFTLGPAELASRSTATLDGPGLTLTFRFGKLGLAVVVPGTILPPWCAAPDKSGASRLATLAQELSMLLVPESLAADDAKATFCPELADALHSGGLADDAAVVSLPVSSAEQSGTLLLAWPLTTPEALASAPAPPAEAAAQSPKPPAPAPTEPAPAKPASPATNRIRDLTGLPGYSRSLLKIRVPVSVQLAAKKELLQEVITMAPGSIIKFEKGCDELLQMIVGERPIAEGEAVKIGEKFGFRVTSMLLPQEQFVPVKKPQRQR